MSRRLAMLALALTAACGGREPGGVDGGLPHDAAQDAGPDARPSEGARDCSRDLDDTLAVFDFEAIVAGETADSTGTHSGQVLGTATSQVPGPAGCGNALRFAADNDDSAIVVPDHPAWQLDMGSVDLWIRIEACPDALQGIISRDALFTNEPGHFSISLLPDCRLEMRVQGQDADVRLRTAPAALDGWHHLGVSFAPDAYEIWLDGALHSGNHGIGGIAGNSNPWAFGASEQTSADGSHAPLVDYLRATAIDRVRVSAVQRSFR